MTIALCILVLLTAILLYFGEDAKEEVEALIINLFGLGVAIGTVVLAIIILILEIWTHVTIVVH